MQREESKFKFQNAESGEGQDGGISRHGAHTHHQTYQKYICMWNSSRKLTGGKPARKTTKAARKIPPAHTAIPSSS